MPNGNATLETQEMVQYTLFRIGIINVIQKWDKTNNSVVIQKRDDIINSEVR